MGAPETKWWAGLKYYPFVGLDCGKVFNNRPLYTGKKHEFEEAAASSLFIDLNGLSRFFVDVFV